MPDFAGSKTQRTNKYAGLRAPQTPCARLAAWTASQNYVLLFSQHLQARLPRQVSAPTGKLYSGLILYRALHFPVITTSLPAAAGQQLFVAYLFIPAITASRQPVTSFRLDRLVRFRSHFFFFFFHSTPLHTPKKGNRQSRFPSLFLTITNLVQI